MIRLPTDLPQIGAMGAHRSGWPYALASLHPLVTPQGLLVDDFVERTFLYRKAPRTSWTEPWIGFFHHPPGMPNWFRPHARVERLLEAPAFVTSLPWLRGAVVLCEHLGAWVRQTFGVATAVIKLPTEVPELQFDLEAYRKNPVIVQVGWYLRNQEAIYQVAVPPGIRKVHLEPGIASARRARDLMRRFGPFRRPVTGDTTTCGHLAPDAYDALLARSVVFLEYITAAASNTVVECMARKTPVVLNRKPALKEYLGADYPLFYESIDEVAELLEPDSIAAAHQYLSQLEMPWLSGAAWSADVRRFIESLLKHMPVPVRSMQKVSAREGNRSLARSKATPPRASERSRVTSRSGVRRRRRVRW